MRPQMLILGLFFGGVSLTSFTHLSLLLRMTNIRQHFLQHRHSFEAAASRIPRLSILSRDIVRDSESLAFLFDKMADMTVFDADVNLTIEEARCARYGWKLRTPAIRRRIFRGSPVADDSWHTLLIMAMEGFGVYHHLSFVESNRTHNHAPRTWRFTKGSNDLGLLQSGMFGPDTEVSMNYYNDENLDKEAHLNEFLQRDVLLWRWRKEGMTVDDLGFMADVDESFTRDFLRAVQICDVPVLRPGQSCQKPKILGASLPFEGSPNCLIRDRRIHHPDMMLGECIESIGDKTKHPVVPLEKRDIYGKRIKGYNPADEELKNATTFPLWNAADFRLTAGGEMYYGVNGENTGYHVHNFVETEDSLRFKHATYGHAYADALTMDLELISNEVKLMAKCARNVSDEGDHYRRETGDIEDDKTLILPIALQFREYREMRHQELVRMIENTYRGAKNDEKA